MSKCGLFSNSGQSDGEPAHLDAILPQTDDPLLPVRRQKGHQSSQGVNRGCGHSTPSQSTAGRIHSAVLSTGCPDPRGGNGYSGDWNHSGTRGILHVSGVQNVS